MRTLLTTERAAELVAMPKRLIRTSELAWQPLDPPKRKLGKKYRATNARQLRARLIAQSTRDTFLLVGSANGSFSFTLKWQDQDLSRIDCGQRHPLPHTPGEPREYVHGPHVHYFVPGYSLDHAHETTEYTFDDPNGALQYFLRHCGVHDAPAVQETLTFL